MRLKENLFKLLPKLTPKVESFLGYDFVNHYLNANSDQNETTILIGDTLFEFGPADISVVLEYLGGLKEQSPVKL